MSPEAGKSRTAAKKAAAEAASCSAADWRTFADEWREAILAAADDDARPEAQDGPAPPP